MSEKSFTPCVFNSTLRATQIRGAKHRVIYCGPGITVEELSALKETTQRLPAGAIHLLLDISPFSFHAGYWGDVNPQFLIEQAEQLLGASIAQGLRLGLLIVDEQAWIYSPTAQSIEVELQQGNEPNALKLNLAATQMLLDSIVACPEEPTVSRETLTAEKIRDVNQALERQPIPYLGLRQMVEALRLRLKIIQFESRGYKINKRTIRLSPEIIDIIGSSDRQINARINADWKVFLEDAEYEIEVKQKRVEKGLAEIKERYLVRLGSYGFGLLSNEEEVFNQAWYKFQKEQVENLKQTVRQRIDRLVQQSQEQLYKLLQEHAQNGTLQIPHQRALYPMTETEYQEHYLRSLIRKMPWPTAQDVVNGISIKRRYYDISEKMLSDTEFRKSLEFHFGNIQEWFEKVANPTEIPSSGTDSFSMN